jgi:hypothetical protein
MLSRRHFLQATGIALAAAHLPRASHAAPTFDPLYGRALSAVPVYPTPQSGSFAKTLWSDAVTPILSTSGAWYRLPDGYARRETLQPMLIPAERHEIPTSPPFLGEVNGAVAVVREWCAADAPLVTRIGHGGVLWVSDLLTLDGIDWYGVRDGADGALLGWTQAPSWSPATPDDAKMTLTLQIDLQAQQLHVSEGTEQLLSAGISATRSLQAGHYAITQRQPSFTSADGHYGAPWALESGSGMTLSGAYWHNQFGSVTNDTLKPDGTIELPPPLARWLYPRAAAVIVS